MKPSTKTILWIEAIFLIVGPPLSGLIIIFLDAIRRSWSFTVSVGGAANYFLRVIMDDQFLIGSYIYFAIPVLAAGLLVYFLKARQYDLHPILAGKHSVSAGLIIGILYAIDLIIFFGRGQLLFKIIVAFIASTAMTVVCWAIANWLGKRMRILHRG